MEKRSTFVDFLIQLIFVILFVILLVWLFPTKDWLKNNYFNNGSYSYEKETTVEDAKYIDNINNMMDASKSYFGYNVNLPENIDDTVSVTLQELVDNHVMIMPKDSKGKKCDGNSKATITKTLNGYTIKVELTCGSDSDYIIRTVGCDPFCSNNCSAKCTLEYEYSKKIDGYYTSWSAWSAWSTSKKTAGENLKVEQKTFTTKVCPSGYTLNSNKTLCIKTVKSSKEVDAEIVKSCPTGYEMDKDGSKCIRTNSSTVTVDAEKVYSCKSGYTLENNKCVKNSTVTSEVDASFRYVCRDDYTVSGNKCVKINTISSTSTSKKTCGSGFVYIGSNTCQSVNNSNISTNIKDVTCSITFEKDCNDGCKVVKKETCTMPANTKYNYTCPSGYSLTEDKKCVSVESINADKDYVCENGTLSGTKCIISSTKKEEIDADFKYICKEGTLSGTKCIIDNTKEESTDVKTNYVCKEGTLNNNKCVIESTKEESTKYTSKNVIMYRYSTRKYVKESISYKWSKSKEDKKLIDAGYKLTGKTRKNCK